MTSQVSIDDAWLSRRVLIAGGHEHMSGGLEIFISRARQCLGIETHLFTETPRSWKPYFHGLYRFVRALSACDIVWLHYGSIFDLAYLLLAKLFGKKVAVTPHLGAGWRSMQNPILRTVGNRLLLASDRIFTLHATQPDTLHFPESLARRCQVMGTFLPQAYWQAEIPPRHRGGPLKLVHIARLSPAKGSLAFLDVCDGLKRRGISFEASMIGAAPEEFRRQLESEIANRGLAIHLVGALPQDDVMRALRQADVLVNLSLQDAYPLTVIEAVLAGAAVVCTSLPGTQELGADAPAITLIEGQDGEAAAAKLATLDYTAIPASIAALRAKFDWTVLQRRYRQTFSGLIDNRPQTPSDIAIKVSVP